PWSPAAIQRDRLGIRSPSAAGPVRTERRPSSGFRAGRTRGHRHRRGGPRRRSPPETPSARSGLRRRSTPHGPAGGALLLALDQLDDRLADEGRRVAVGRVAPHPQQPPTGARQSDQIISHCTVQRTLTSTLYLIVSDSTHSTSVSTIWQPCSNTMG